MFDQVIDYTRNNPGLITALCAALVIILLYLWYSGSIGGSSGGRRSSRTRGKKGSGPDKYEKIDDNIEEEIQDVLAEFK